MLEMAQECLNWKFMCYRHIVVVAFLIMLCDAQCSQDANGVYRYGLGCVFMCHCLTSEQCDFRSGECQSGCDFDWVGPGCQYKNIAIEQISRQIDNISPHQYSERAVDRSLSTCSYTGDENTPRSRNPWWKVWLPYTFTMRQMEILTLDSHRRFFNGFKVIVEYVPENENINFDYYPDQSQICYTHNDTMLKTTSEKVTCDKYFTGNQVRIQLSDTRTQLVLCDVRIHGDCSENVCGYDCNKVCHCKDITAGDKVTGICSNGCTGRWSGDDGACDIQCKISQWGETCQNKCGHCRDNEPCNVVTGKCPTGCEDGYKNTDLCDRECEDGTYGQNCNTTCSGNCKNKKPCTKSSGHCVDGCAPGYIGDKCDERCPLSFYGTDCKDNCSVFCTGGLPSCSNVNGSCLSGCVTGYKGLHCDKAAKQEGTETKMHISGGGLAGIVLTGVVLVFITAISTLFVAKRMQRTNMERRQNTFENEEVCYSNVSAESTSLTVNRTPGDEDING